MKLLKILSIAVSLLLIQAPAYAEDVHGTRDNEFTIAVIPDTQYYLDYKHQKKEGFPFDAYKMFLEQMEYIADNLKANGGDIAFVTSVGDIWQHQSLKIDPGHAARDFRAVPNPLIDDHLAPTSRLAEVEMPIARDGFGKIAGQVPFSVVPGNHDYDAMWTDSKRPPSPGARLSDMASLGVLHSGGLDNFRSVFGSDSPFFKDKDWYVDSHDGGADSAQLFSAGGYKFLHIGLQFSPPDASLKWAERVIRKYRGLPTIITTHDYLNGKGERLPNPLVDQASVDELDNSPEDVWRKLIAANPQIFLVLSGHQHGQALRVDKNKSGNDVYQVLADYQDRRQTAIAAGYTSDFPYGVGDGWLRLMKFDFSKEVPEIKVSTYSTYFRLGNRNIVNYAEWYKKHEQPDMTDEEFYDSDDYVIRLPDFYARFGVPGGR